MREILFRGKRTDGKGWLYGYYSFNPTTNIHWIRTPRTTYWDEDMVDPSTVGQYTGLKDKDGKRIFEGDILRIAKISDGLGSYYHPPLDYPVNVVVKWDLCAWMWETLCEDKRYISFPNAWCHYECEIIGNIHDNPELLEGGDEE